MSIVKLRDKKSGIVYVYESESYWDKEKKQPRNKRKLIGKLDEATGEIVPTRKQNRNKTEEKSIPIKAESDQAYGELIEMLAEKDKTISELNAQVECLKKEKQEFISQLANMYKKWCED